MNKRILGGIIVIVLAVVAAGLWLSTHRPVGEEEAIDQPTSSDAVTEVQEEVPTPVQEPEGTPEHDELTPVVMEKNGYRVSHPKALSDRYGTLQVTTIAALRANLERYREKGGCPGRCGELLADASLYEKQFTLLEQSAQCGYSDSFVEEVKNNFQLFHYAIGGPERVSEVYNEDLDVCGFTVLGFSGYDVSLENYYYETVFVVDQDVVTISFPLLPRNVFADLDEALYLRENFDELDYYQNEFSYDNDLVRMMIDRYDAIVASLEKI